MSYLGAQHESIIYRDWDIISYENCSSQAQTPLLEIPGRLTFNETIQSTKSPRIEIENVEVFRDANMSPKILSLKQGIGAD